MTGTVRWRRACDDVPSKSDGVFYFALKRNPEDRAFVGGIFLDARTNKHMVAAFGFETQEYRPNLYLWGPRIHLPDPMMEIVEAVQ